MTFNETITGSSCNRVKNLSKMAPPIIQRCSTTSSFGELILLVKRNKLAYCKHNHDNYEKVGFKI